MKNPFLMQRLCWVVAILVAFSGLLVVSGCGTMGESAEEVRIRHHRANNNNLGRIQDDVDAALLLDRPSRLSSQPVR